MLGTAACLAPASEAAATRDRQHPPPVSRRHGPDRSRLRPVRSGAQTALAPSYIPPRSAHCASRAWYRAASACPPSRCWATSPANPDRPTAFSVRLSLIHISEPTRLLSISYAVFCLKKKKNHHHK